MPVLVEVGWASRTTLTAVAAGTAVTAGKAGVVAGRAVVAGAAITAIAASTPVTATAEDDAGSGGGFLAGAQAGAATGTTVAAVAAAATEAAGAADARAAIGALAAVTAVTAPATAASDAYGVPTVAAGAAGADQQGDPTGAAGPADPSSTGGYPAGPAIATGTEQDPAGPAGPARSRGGGVGRTVPAVTAVAPQDSARPTVLPGPRRPVGAIADQRTTQQRLGGRIDHTQHLLLGLQQHAIADVDDRIQLPRIGQCLHELHVEGRHLDAQRLIVPRVAGKQRRDRRRNLVGGGGRQRRRSDRCHRVGLADHGRDTAQIRRRRREHRRCCDHEGHGADLPGPAKHPASRSETDSTPMDGADRAASTQEAISVAKQGSANLPVGW